MQVCASSPLTRKKVPFPWRVGRVSRKIGVMPTHRPVAVAIELGKWSREYQTTYTTQPIGRDTLVGNIVLAHLKIAHGGAFPRWGLCKASYGQSEEESQLQDKKRLGEAEHE